MDLLWSFIYTLVYTQCKSQGTKSKQGEGCCLPSLNLPWTIAFSWTVQPSVNSGPGISHMQKKKWFCFQVACALGGKLTHTGNSHNYCCLCSAMVPERLCRTDACLRARRGCVLGLTFCGVGTWLFVPTCHPPSLFPKGPSLPPHTTPVQEAQHLREVISTPDSGESVAPAPCCTEWFRNPEGGARRHSLGYSEKEACLLLKEIHRRGGLLLCMT